MNRKLLTAAVSAALVAGFSGAASALTPQSGLPDLVINMSGATALDNSISSMFRSLCEPGTVNSYFNDGSNPGNRYRAFYCTVTKDQVAGLDQNELNVLFVKRSAGGSAQGVNPILDLRRLEALNIFNSNCEASPIPLDPDRYLCSIDGGITSENLVWRYSDIGISDVDVKMFTGVNKPDGFNPVNPARADGLFDTRAVAALIFGIPVNNSLYNALQYAQRVNEDIPQNCTIGEYEREECMPSLTKGQVASLISGQVKNWKEFKIGNQSLVDIVQQGLASEPALSLPQLVVTNPSRAESAFYVRYCKRVNGSGTGAQQYAKFLNNPCTTGAGEPIQNNNLTLNSGPLVIQNSGSGDVELCLTDYENGVSNTQPPSNPPVGPAATLTPRAKAWAIGVQSLEKNDKNAVNKFPYKFVKIDGVAPTLENAFNGKYMDVVELTYQWLKNGSVYQSDTRPVCDDSNHLESCKPAIISGNKRAIIEEIRFRASQPTVVGSVLNVNSDYPFGLSGYLAPANPWATDAQGFTGILNEQAPIWPYTHDIGGGLNNCTVPVMRGFVTKKPLL